MTSGRGTHIFSENSLTVIESPIIIVSFFFKLSETLYVLSAVEAFVLPCFLRLVCPTVIAALEFC